MKELTLRILMVILFATTGLTLSAQIPAGYYSSADGLTQEALWNELQNIIENPNTTSYSQVDEKFVELGTDEDPNNSSNIIYFYMRDSRPSSGFSGNGNGDDNSGAWNKEHVWPRSRGVGDGGDDQQDMHMLRPTDVDVNSRRGSKDFGIVSGNNTANGSYFEPHDEVKGDVARILFYMATCYKGTIFLVENVTNSGNQLGNLSLMLDWHEADPVNDIERERNDKVYSSQNNRNPFVDHPEYVNAIWGDGTIGDNPTISLSTTSLSFGDVLAGNSSASQSYTVSGADLEGDVVVEVNSPFEVSLNNSSWSNQVIISQANAEAGSSNTVFVRFSPQVADGEAYSEDITHSSTNATNVTLSVTGSESTISLDDIADVRSGSAGIEYVIEGIVTSHEMNDGSGQFFIQDESAGIFIYYSDNAGLVNRGDRVRITGERLVFENQIELAPSELTIISTGQPLPDPADITNSDLIASSDYLGSLVRLVGVTLTTPSEWPTGSTTIGTSVPASANGTSFVIRIDENSFYDGSSTPDGSLVIQGVLDVYEDDIQIFPFVDGDVQEETGLDPMLSVNPISLDFGMVSIGTSSTLSFVVSGSDLTENVSLVTTGSFELSLSETEGFATSLSVGVDGGSVNSTVFVRFSPISDGQSTSSISLQSSGESGSVSLTGEGIENTTPLISINSSGFNSDFGTIAVGEESDVRSYEVSGENLTESVTVTAPNGFMVSVFSNFGFASTIDLGVSNGTLTSKTIYVLFMPQSVGFFDGDITHKSGDLDEGFEVLGESGNVELTIDASGFNGDFGQVILGQNSIVGSYLLSGQNISDQVQITAPSGFEVSFSQSIDFASVISFSPTGSSFSDTQVFVRFSPSSSGLLTGSVVNLSGTESESLTVSGSGMQVTATAPIPTIKIYPNPVDGILKVENLPMGGTIRIFDSMGRRMNVLKSGDGIDISGFDSGQYYLTIAGSANGVMKFLVR